MSLALITGGLNRLFPQLSGGELSVLSYLIYRGEALTAAELALNTTVFRTKVYGIMNKLIANSLIEEVVQSVDGIERPEIWEWWPESRRSRWLTAQNLHLVKWIPRVDIIRVKIDDAEIDFRFFRELRRIMRRENG